MAKLIKCEVIPESTRDADLKDGKLCLWKEPGCDCEEVFRRSWENADYAPWTYKVLTGEDSKPPPPPKKLKVKAVYSGTIEFELGKGDAAQLKKLLSAKPRDSEAILDFLDMWASAVDIKQEVYITEEHKDGESYQTWVVDEKAKNVSQTTVNPMPTIDTYLQPSLWDVRLDPSSYWTSYRIAK
jgi:hypothetical protein